MSTELTEIPDLILWAIPLFLLAVALEIVDMVRDEEVEVVHPDRRDTVTSITMGLGYLFVEGLFWKAVVFAGYVWLSQFALFDLGWTWPVWLFAWVLEDLSYYWYHRGSHEIRILWASHVVHHSSQQYNLSTALRQTWTPFHTFAFWAPMVLLGVPVIMVFTLQSVSLLYQFWIHTERIDRLAPWFEAVFNTPSHHRVHHGSQSLYLDRNYGGILIVWDRLFGTFEPESERVVYGLTTDIETYNPLRVAFHEYAAIWRDVTQPGLRLRDRLQYPLRGPGWRPASLVPTDPEPVPAPL